MQCTSTKKDRTPCGANAIHGSTFCFSHDPASRGKKAEAVRKGGAVYKAHKEAQLRKRVPIRSFDDIQFVLEETINGLRSDPMTASKAGTIGYLCSLQARAIELNKIQAKVDVIYEVAKLPQLGLEQSK